MGHISVTTMEHCNVEKLAWRKHWGGCNVILVSEQANVPVALETTKQCQGLGKSGKQSRDRCYSFPGLFIFGSFDLEKVNCPVLQ